MTPISIREFQPSDEAEVAALFDDFLDFFVELDPLKRCIRPHGAGQILTRRMIEKSAVHEGALLVAESGSQIIGFVAGIIQTQSAEELLESIPAKTGRVIEPYLAPEYRGQGIGKALVEKMEAVFRSRHCDLSVIEVFAPNHHAHELYHRLGYAERTIDLIKELK